MRWSGWRGSATGWSGRRRWPPIRAIGPRRAAWPRSCPFSMRSATAQACRRWSAWWQASTPSSAWGAARQARDLPRGGKPHDPDHRRPSPHLAAGRPALAAGTDGAAHLRALRADPARLSDRGISRRHRRFGHREIGLCPVQLGQGQGGRGSRLGARGRRRAWLAARHRRLCRPARRERRRHAEAAIGLSADARHPHAAALARQRDVPFRADPRPDEPHAVSPQHQAARRLRLVVRPAGFRLADGGCGEARRRQSRHHLHPAACRHAGGPVRQTAARRGATA